MAEQGMTGAGGRFDRAAERSGRATIRPHDVNRRWYLLLLVPLVGTLIPPIYNNQDPQLFGIPFFYWYQMVWIAVSVVCTVVVYRRTRGD
jgi:Protein of unknown function (DUF3311)